MPTTTNPAVFAVNLKGYGKQLRLDAVKVFNDVTFRLYAFIVDDWRVDTGRSRAGWAISIHVAGNHAPGPGTYGKPAASAFIGALEFAPLEATRVMYNNVHYSVWLEIGTSRGSGDHVVAMSILRITSGG